MDFNMNLLTKEVFCVLLVINLTMGCNCDHKTSNNGDNNIEKRNIGPEEITTDSNIMLIKLKKASENFGISEVKRELFAKETKNIEIDSQLNGTLSLNIKNEFEEMQFNVTDEKKKEECLYLTNGRNIDLEDMADVWRTAYYRTSERLACFKIHIKKASSKNLKMNAEKYKDYNGNIEWNNCLLEIKTDDTNENIARQHFLQAKYIDQGVFENIIIIEDSLAGNSTPIVMDQSPDQWMIYENLLLMRDCDNGEVVVFTRVPHQPQLENILDALKAFGEETFNGTLACIDEDRIERSVRNILRQVLSRLKLF